MKISRRKFFPALIAGIDATLTSLNLTDDYGDQILSYLCGCHYQKSVLDYLTSVHLPTSEASGGVENNRPAYGMIPNPKSFEVKRSKFLQKTNIKKFLFCYDWYKSYFGPNGETFGTRHWNEGYHYRPVRGEYDSQNPLLIRKHLNDARVNNFIPIYSWWEKDGYEDVTLRNYVLQSPYLRASKLEFGVLYESEKIGGKYLDCEIDLKSKEQKVYDDFDHLNETVISHPNYFMIGKKPGIFIFNPYRFNPEEAAVVLSNLRERTREKYGRELFLIGTFNFWDDPNDLNGKIRKLIKLFDGITAYNLYRKTNLTSRIPSNFKEDALKRCEVYSSLSEYFVQPTLQTFRKFGNPDLILTEEEYKYYLGMSRDIARSTSRKMPMMSGVYNEFHESVLEETIECGKGCLDAFGSI